MVRSMAGDGVLSGEVRSGMEHCERPLECKGSLNGDGQCLVILDQETIEDIAEDRGPSHRVIISCFSIPFFSAPRIPYKQFMPP